MFFLHVPQQVKTRFTSFPLVIATVARVSRKRGLWLVVRVNDIPAHMDAWAGMDCVNNLISDQPVV